MTENPHLNAVQKALLKLQALETEGAKVSRAFQDHPAHNKREQLLGAGNKVLGEYSKLDKKFSELNKEITGLEDELEGLRAKNKEEKELLNNTSDARSAQALSRSIDTHTRRIDKIEFDLLGLMERREEEQAQMKFHEDSVEKLKAAIAELDAGMKKLHDQVDEKLASLSAERKALMEEIPDELLDRYRKAVRNHKGIGIEEYRPQTGSGSVCSVKLSVIQKGEVERAAGEVISCPACRRLMVVGDA